jgi:hypothetical protein
MLRSESPFPCDWWGIGLEHAGLGDVRPDVGTYGRYEFENLPRLPFELQGDFGWLASVRRQQQHIGQEKAVENQRAFSSLRESAAHLGVQLPASFMKFMQASALQERIRCNTDCFLDLCGEPIRSPIADGWLVRFLADSQGCVFWYVYLTADGSDHAVVSSPGFFGTEAEQWQEQPPNPDDIAFCAESFEAFMCRFWLENEIWFAEMEKASMPEALREYIERYRKKG